MLFGVTKCIKRSRDPSIASDALGPVLGRHRRYSAHFRQLFDFCTFCIGFLQIGSESSFRVPKEPTAVWWASRPLNTPSRHHSSRSTHFEDFPFSRTRKIPGKLQEKDLTRYCGVLKDPPPPWWTCRLLRTPRYPYSS